MSADGNATEGLSVGREPGTTTTTTTTTTATTTTTTTAAPLRCPTCHAGLDLSGRSWTCEGGHSFDLARSGYVNLVTGSRAKQAASGYSPEMMRARRRLFDTGAYAPFRAAVQRTVTGLGARCVLDIGCGEGYYLRDAGESARWDEVQRIGIDLSKSGIDLAARADTAGLYAVANSYDIPLLDASVDCAISVFSPVPAAEVERVVRPGGSFVHVGPGPRHLIELRERLYDTVHPLGAPSKEVPPHWVRAHEEHEETVDAPLTDVPEEVLRLIVDMSPYRFASADTVAAVGAVGTLTLQFVLRRYLPVSPEEPGIG